FTYETVAGTCAGATGPCSPDGRLPGNCGATEHQGIYLLPVLKTGPPAGNGDESMSKGPTEHENQAHPITDPDITSLSNSVRLSGRQWILVGLCAVLTVLFVPHLWKHVEKFDLEMDYRMPYDQSQDYWL